MRSFLTPYILNLLDLLLTLYAIQHGGVELNPLMQSVPVMVGWKTVGAAALCAVMQNVECRMWNAECRMRGRGGWPAQA